MGALQWAAAQYSLESTPVKAWRASVQDPVLGPVVLVRLQLE